MLMSNVLHLLSLLLGHLLTLWQRITYRKSRTNSRNSTAGPAATERNHPPHHFWVQDTESHQIAAEEQLFHKNFAPQGYGYCPGPGTSATLSDQRSFQFPQLKDITYLDHAAATLYAKQQLDSAHAELLGQLFANPHTQLSAGLDHTAMAVEELRQLTLSMLQAPAEEYEVVFTAGATAALKLAGEAFPWTPTHSSCAYLSVNHNSALGVRQLAAAAGAATQMVEVELLQQQLQRLEQCREQQCQDQQCQGRGQPQHVYVGDYQSQVQQQQRQGVPVQQMQQQQIVYSLFITPAECNFSGTRYNSQQLLRLWKQQAQHHEWQQQQQQDMHLEDHDLHLVTQQVPPEIQVPQLTAIMATNRQQQQQQEQQAHSSVLLNEEQQSQPSNHHHQQQGQQWLLLVDAAKACASRPPDCSKCDIDMLALSYYKIFGYPTGLGALVVRRSLLPQLLRSKAFFGGGTVEVVLPDQHYVVRRTGAAGLEDGTLPFTAVAAARHGFKQLQQLGGFPAISRHMATLTWALMLQLKQLKHSNGRAAALLYCSPAVQQLLQQHLSHAAVQQCSSTSTGAGAASSPTAAAVPAAAAAFVAPSSGVLNRFIECQGSVVTFNLLRPDASWVGHREVAKLAAIHRICLRTGCFCNPGACAHYLGLTAADMKANHAAGHVCWDDNDLMEGRPTGAVRASFGYMSTYSDLAVLMLFLHKFFVDCHAGVAAVAAAAAGAEADAAHDAYGVAVSSPAADIAAQVAAGDGVAVAAIAPCAKPSRSVQHQDKQGSRPVDCKGLEGASCSSAPSLIALSTSTAQHSSSAAVTPAAAHAAGSLSSGSCPESKTATVAGGVAVAACSGGSDAAGRLTALYLYPVKSCAPQQVPAWPLGPNGLLYDREWALCGPDGQILTQKRAPRLTQVQPEVDLMQGVLRLSAPGIQRQLVVSLDGNSSSSSSSGCDAIARLQGVNSAQEQQQQQQQQEQQQQVVRVCGDTVCTQKVVGQVLARITSAAPAAAAVDAQHPSSSSTGDLIGTNSGTGARSSNSSASATAAGEGSLRVDASSEDADMGAGAAAVQEWFAAAVGIPCRLVRQLPSSRTVKQPKQKQQQGQHLKQAQQPVAASSIEYQQPASPQLQPAPTLGFANEGQYLLVNQASIDYVAAQLVPTPAAHMAHGKHEHSATTAAAAAAAAGSNQGLQSSSQQGAWANASSAEVQLGALRFRPNLVVSGFKPWAEDAWERISFGRPDSCNGLGGHAAVADTDRSSSSSSSQQ